MLKKYLNGTIPFLAVVLAMVLSVSAQGNKDKDSLNLDKTFKQISRKMAQTKLIVDKSGDSKAIFLFAKATFHYNKALEINANGKKDFALNELRITSRFLAMALEEAKVITQLDDLLEKIANKISNLKSIIGDNNNHAAFELFSAGEKQYLKALDLKKEGNEYDAYAKARIALRFIERAGDLVFGGDSIDRMLDLIGKQIKKDQLLIENSGNNIAIKIFNEGMMHYTKALDLDNQSKHKEARIEAVVAKLLVDKAKKIISQ